jgi:hypothetical protein
MGQFQWFTTLGLSLYVGEDVAQGQGLAFAIVLWGLQVIWYIGVGAIALATPYVSLSELLHSRALDDSPEPADRLDLGEPPPDADEPA